MDQCAVSTRSANPAADRCHQGPLFHDPTIPVVFQPSGDVFHAQVMGLHTGLRVHARGGDMSFLMASFALTTNEFVVRGPAVYLGSA